MRLDSRNMPGPGDEETWGPCTGHPMDPRTEEPPEPDEAAIKEEMGYLLEDLGEVELAILKYQDYPDELANDFLKKCADYLETEDWLALGKLIGQLAVGALEEKAYDKAEEREPPEEDYDEDEARRRYGR